MAKDGSSRQQGSLFGEILDWMLAPLLLIWPISVALTWLVAQGIAGRPYDRELGEMARSLGQQAAATYYQARVKLEPSELPLAVGMHGQAKILADWQPLGSRLLRWLQLTFRM